MISVGQLERRIIVISVAVALTLFALAALAVNVYHVGLPTCLTDIKPFEKGELITHSPTHYELHYVARMWTFEPEDVTVPAGYAMVAALSPSPRLPPTPCYGVTSRCTRQAPSTLFSLSLQLSISEYS